ncbi:MAG: potassium transporter TrkA [Sulfobacillus benefaciens]|uniref:Potassium transporter TrkA n=1 Tax=Sulfobacillus benefaciens TaxID=453960 RepID=A0A2T2X9N9_9FIRM|nr:MAG: potassium transporter TrkA [Sulfobacillus benefaciens]
MRGASMAEVLVIGILFLVMVLLVSGRVRIDVAGVVSLALVGLFHLVPIHSLFSGFSSYAAIILAEMFILGEGLRRSGATDVMAGMFEKIGRRGEPALLTALMALPPIPSTFISDVGLMSIFLPTMMRIRQSLKISLHRLLMPLAFSIALGGLLSMIGSAGNIIGNAALASSHYAPIPLFGITPLGIILVLAGFMFMKLWGIRHLPASNGQSEFLSNYQEVKSYISEVRVNDDSTLVDRSLREVGYFRQHHLTVLRIIRANGHILTPGANDTIRAGDRLVVQGDVQAILDLQPEFGMEVVGTDPSTMKLRRDNIRVVEAMIPPRSPLVSHTLRGTNFRTKYGATVLAILRQGVTRIRELPVTPLRAGDVLLVTGTDDAIARLQMADDLTVFADVEHAVSASPRRSVIAGLVVLGVLVAAAVNFLAIQAAAAVGILVLLMTRIISMNHAYRAIDWRIITLVGGITPLSLALTRLGVSAEISHTLIRVVGPLGPYAILAVFFWLAAFLTQVISNVAAALVLAPLAISVAGANHWSPDGLIISMVIALSAAPITPLANKVFIMAMGPGRYRYQDFFRIGVPFTIVMFVLTVILVPAFFPFVH